MIAVRFGNISARSCAQENTQITKIFFLTTEAAISSIIRIEFSINTACCNLLRHFEALKNQLRLNIFFHHYNLSFELRIINFDADCLSKAKDTVHDVKLSGFVRG